MSKRMFWGMAACALALLPVWSFAQAKPAAPPDPAKQLQAAIASVQAKLAAMEAKYSSVAIAGKTLDAAYAAKKTSGSADASTWNEWLAAAWNDDRPFYQKRLDALQAELAALKKNGSDPDIGKLKSSQATWEKSEKQIAAAFQKMVDDIAQQAAVLAQAAKEKDPAKKAALQRKAAQLKTDAEQQRAAANKAATGPGKPKDTGKPADKNPKGGKGDKGDKGDKGGKGSGGKGDKGDKGGKVDKGGDQGEKPTPPTPEQQTVTVCKCKPSEFPFQKQTTNESISSSDPEIATASIADGRLTVTGKKYGTTTITVKGDVVKYNVGIPDQPAKGKGGIHGNGPNEVPLNGNYGFAYVITVHVVCDLNGSWSGPPVGTVKLVDACGTVKMATAKSVFSGNATLGSKGYTKIKLTHTLTLDEVSKGLPEPVRAQVAGRQVTIEGTIAPDENSISGTYTQDKVDWKEQDGQYTVTFPGKESRDVLITRDGAGAAAAGKKGKGN